jgi:endonuclease/exonuclease/phosphatase family metal-dependent hydrolase
MQYWLLKRLIPATDRARVIDELVTLRAQLERTVPNKDSEDNLLLASWNIRDLGKGNRRGFGKRMAESHFYIAEVISRFDFVAVQEVNDLPEWQQIMNILGPHWDYIATDVADTAGGGNGERMAFAFDKRKVSFRNIAGEIVLPEKLMISQVTGKTATGQEITGGRQFSRTPFIAAFQSACFRFDICTVHIYYGADSGAKLKRRVEEIDGIANYLANRADKAFNGSNAMILLGDFNIVSPDHKTMAALLKHGFTVPYRGALNRSAEAQCRGGGPVSPPVHRGQV